MPQPRFDRSQLNVLPLNQRIHDMGLDYVLPLALPTASYTNPKLDAVCDAIVQARTHQRPVILIMGAHVIKQGASRFVIDLMERGLITHVAMNGAGLIHDYELALIGATTESVATYISQGQFGLWSETGDLNTLISQAAAHDLGLGEYVGSVIEQHNFAHKDLSIAMVCPNVGDIETDFFVCSLIAINDTNESVIFDIFICSQDSLKNFFVRDLSFSNRA